jgi:hypothetical protein
VFPGARNGVRLEMIALEIEIKMPFMTANCHKTIYYFQLDEAAAVLDG